MSAFQALDSGSNPDVRISYGVSNFCFFVTRHFFLYNGKNLLCQVRAEKAKGKKDPNRAFLSFFVERES